MEFKSALIANSDQTPNPKGQKISKANHIVLTSSKKRTKYLPNSVLASIG